MRWPISQYASTIAEFTAERALARACSRMALMSCVEAGHFIHVRSF
jgi:hypothetical protein